MKHLEKQIRVLQGLKKDPPGLWGLTQLFVFTATS